MKLWKSKEEKRVEAAAARQQVLENLRVTFDEAVKTPDTADRLVKLDQLREVAQGVEDLAKGAIHSKSSSKLVLPYLTVTFGSLTAAFFTVGALAATPALMILPMIPAIMGGMYLGEKRGAAHAARMEKELQPFFEALTQQQADIAAATGETVGRNIRELAASPKFTELQALPGLREHFMAALRQSLSDAKEPGVTPPPKNDGTGFRL